MRDVWEQKTAPEIASRNEKWFETLASNGSKLGRKPFPSIETQCDACGAVFTQRDTKYKKRVCSTKCWGLFRVGSKASPETVAKQKLVPRKYPKPGLRKHDLPEYRKYKNRVAVLTAQTYKQYKDIINPLNHPRGLAGVEGAYHLDHIKMVRECFDEGLSPEQASDVTNLRMLPWRENVMRTWNK